MSLRLINFVYLRRLAFVAALAIVVSKLRSEGSPELYALLALLLVPYLFDIVAILRLGYLSLDCYRRERRDGYEVEFSSVLIGHLFSEIMKATRRVMEPLAKKDFTFMLVGGVLAFVASIMGEREMKVMTVRILSSEFIEDESDEDDDEGENDNDHQEHGGAQ